MKTILSYVVILITTINCYAQITFEKGYFINNSGEKVECLIKNLDWKDNPTEFTYKLTSDSSEKISSISSVEEFGIYNLSKYIRANVDIDKSSDITGKLSDNRNPIFTKEILFLKVLIEGDANLFSYENSNLKRFFFKKDTDTIKQLIYKRYLSHTPSNGRININERYKQQLLKSLKCETISIKKIKSLSYKENSLSNFFIKYNQCKNSKTKQFNKTNNVGSFRLTAKIGVNNSSLKIHNENFNDSRNTDFGGKSGIRFGLEGEFILPFNKNKWSILLEANYQSFKTQKTTENNSISGGILVSKVDYSSVEAILGIKHNFFLNKKSKIFISVGYLHDFPNNSSILFERGDGSLYNTLDIKAGGSLVIGTGYKYDKYSFELRYNNRDLLGNYSYWSSDYKSLSLNIGYTIF
ncbi:tRNA modification GTPase [Tenacibaculum caenipelagi]|uniref:tRNA modification GTPase n=1 Tax=Tenacibaculum caenipelagi TaxID=1325435 RepID=A0A4R6TG65_9FLAO|nr:tRNA modification GTPase [Tenacibaculum caenipelagi]TDQ28833.1 hypothetical protein DFQ07_1214 [Tenacibaculum caenipelagi]